MTPAAERPILPLLLGALAFSVAFAVPASGQDIDCGYPLNQMEMTYCAEKGWLENDKRLNEAYRSAMARMKETDQYLPADLRGAADALRDAQRAWIPYRDKACAAEGYLARGGSMEPMLIYGCLAMLTAQRTEALLALAKGLEN